MAEVRAQAERDALSKRAHQVDVVVEDHDLLAQRAHVHLGEQLDQLRTVDAQALEAGTEALLRPELEPLRVAALLKLRIGFASTSTKRSKGTSTSRARAS